MTNPFAASLEALDLKAGRIHNTEDWRRAGEKSEYTPEALTDDDLVILSYFDGEAAGQRARARRAHALAPPPPPDPPAAKTKAAAPRHVVEFPDRLWDDDAPDVVKAMEQWSATYALKAIPVALWHAFVAGGREKREALAAKVVALERRLTALEAKPSVKFCGTWERGKTYEPGEAVVRDGGLWICKATTPGEPSRDFVGWQLAVKQGSAR